MQPSHRLLASLVAGVAIVSIAFASKDVRGRTQALEAELIRRSVADATTLQSSLASVARLDPPSAAADAALDRLSRRAGLAGAIVFDEQGRVVSRTDLPDVLRERAQELAGAEPRAAGNAFGRVDGVSMLVHLEPTRDPTPFAAVAVIRNASEIDRQVTRMWRDLALRVVIEAALIIGITLFLIRWSLVRPVSRTAAWLRGLRLGTAEQAPAADNELLRPLLKELTHLVTSLERARATAEEEARLRDSAESTWTAERLRAHVRGRLHNRPILVVSNREPYTHVRGRTGIETIVPASGLVTALEPILRACGGTWIAHGSGDADRETVDRRDRVRVPPEQPEYTLRRVWLTPEQEEGYYYGLSNEGLWPLCHIAHTRPLFRAGDWACYRQANQAFADAVLDELEGTDEPIVLVQDYHFALLPRLIKQARPDARVGVFWHIPWPNAEAFGICPWQAEVLDGLLGADLIGFHTQAHCNNFLETVDRAFESHIEWDHFSVRRQDHLTHVRAFPISVDTPVAEAPGGATDTSARRAQVLERLESSADLLGIGVDRIDYTKGLLERFHGLERFFEKWNRYVGRFTFVQIAAPSRTRIRRYQDLNDEVASEVARINARFGTSTWKPIVLSTRHHSHQEIAPFYQCADICLVTSLHDGMNLVAKEFVAAQTDEDGVLVLSRFAGASRELRDALIVNPYDTEQVADAIRRGLEMAPDERRIRMRRMRATVREHNVYRWAATLINDLADVRIDVSTASSEPSRALPAWLPRVADDGREGPVLH